MITPPNLLFRRYSFTWLSYGMIAYFAYVEAVLESLMPFLRTELHLNYTLAGVHFSLYALGVVAAGSLADRIGIELAFGVVCVLLVFILAITLTANRNMAARSA